MRTATIRGLCLATLLLPTLLAGADREAEFFHTRSIEVDLAPVATGAAAVSGYQLWFTSDGGKSWQAVEQIHTGPPPIKFVAPGDGTYGFRVVALDRAGRQQAPPEPGDKPELSCVIDTLPPLLEVYAPAHGKSLFAGSPMVLHWSCEDPNLDASPLVIEYRRGADLPWERVNLQEAYPARGRQQWFTPFVDGELQIRFRAHDQAGNETSWYTESPIKVIPYLGFRGTRGIAAQPYSAFRRFPIYYAPVKFSPVEIDTIEIWYRKGLQDWKRLVDPDRRSPFIFEAPGDGTYSIYLRSISRNGADDREPPHPDTPADTEVLVDTHPPEGTLRVGSGTSREFHKAGERVTISWQVNDENLHPEGSRIEVSLDGGDHWNLLKDGLRNIDSGGQFSWRPPLIEAESLAFRLVARDLAGNLGRIEASTRMYLINPIQDGPQTSRDHHARAMQLVKERPDRPSVESAIERLELAINYDGRNAAAWHDRGALLTLLGRHQESLTNYQKAHDLAPGDLDFAFGLVQGHLNLYRQEGPNSGHFATAKRIFDTISKVELYKNEDYRTLLATYRVLSNELDP